MICVIAAFARAKHDPCMINSFTPHSPRVEDRAIFEDLRLRGQGQGLDLRGLGQGLQNVSSRTPPQINRSL